MRILWLALLACALPTAAAAQSGQGPPVDVVVDPRIELMGVVQLLGDYFLVTDHDFAYRREARAYFAEHSDHRAVRMSREMREDGFAFDAVPRTFLTLSAPPELAPRKTFGERAVSAAGGRERLEAFVAAVRDFARTAEFMRFFEAHRDSYVAILERARPEAARAVGTLSDYTGIEPRHGTVVVGMLLHDGGFGPRLRFGPDSMEVYAVVGPRGVEDDAPVFGPAERLMGLTWHELGHSIVNPLTRERREEVARWAELHEPIAELMERGGYHDWETVVNEHVIRAIETRLTRRVFGEEAGERERRGHAERGFRHLDALLERLEAYEANRDRYPTIADFYPRLLDVFREAAERAGSG